MANFIPVETTENKLSTIPVGDGNFIFCVDSGEVYVDTSLGSISSKRKRAVPRYIRSPVALLTTAGATLGLDSIGSIDDPIVDNTFTFVKENRAFYYFDSSATDAPNGGDIIQPAYITAGPGRWLMFTSKSAGSFPALQLTRPDFNGLTHLVIEASVLPSFTSPTVIINTATSSLHRSKVYAYNGISYIEHPAGGLDMTHSLKAVIVTMDMLSTVNYIRYKWTTASGDSDWYATVFPSSAETVYTRINIAENGNWVINGLDTGRPSRGATGAPGTPGAPGAPGATGPANTLTIGTVTGGVTASATIAGVTPTQILNLVLPKGDDGGPGPAGAPGPANVLSIASVEAGESADVTISGTAPSQALSFVLPRGIQGEPGGPGPAGPANTLSIGTVAAGETASATITGTAPTQTLNLVLPKGDTGATGPATQVAVASTETTAAGTNAVVTIEGEPPAQVLRFKIPRGATGIAGASIVWKGSLSAAPSTPVANWVYRNTTDGVIYIYTGSSWTKMVQDGTPIVWKGVLSTAPGSPQLNWTYRNSVSGKAYIYTGSTWDIIVEDGVPAIWKGALSSAPAGPELNWVYRNTTDGKVYIYDGSAWQLMVQDGLPAVWRGDSATPPTIPGLNDIYRNTADGKVYIYDGSAWQFMVQDGRDPSFSIGAVQTGNAGTLASVSITGNITSGYVLNLTIPRGYTGIQGATGPANTLSIGTVTSDTTASATITGTAPTQTLNLVLPKGDTGPVGPVGPPINLRIITTVTGAPGTNAMVSVGGTAEEQTFSFTIPRGNIGATGPQGISIVWQGEFASAPANPQLNWVYYNTTNKKAYIYDGSAWVRIVEDGTSIVWKGSLSVAPADPELNWGYRNTTDGKSYIYNGAVIGWTIMNQDGAPGAPGADGVDGVDGASIFQQNITTLSGTPVSIDAGGVYAWSVSAVSVLNKGTWANTGLEYAVIIINISGSGTVTTGAGISIIDPLTSGTNMCILRSINGVISLFVNPE